MLLAKKHGFKTLDSWVVRKGEIPEDLEYPIITKDISPNSGSWKSDVFICQDEGELKAAFESITSPTILIQRFVDKKNKLYYEFADELLEHVKELRQGNPIREPIYSFITCTRSEETNRVEPKKVLIIEGILCLANKALRDLMDIKVFVDCDSDVRLSRVIMRDILERGRNIEQVLSRYEKTVRPSHLLFIEPTKRFADIIIPQGGMNQVAITILTNHISQTLKNQ
ncbi:MAG: uridine kinase [Bacteroidia bacterium]|nr:uridine kinase [Bacteroidia bacterium]